MNAALETEVYEAKSQLETHRKDRKILLDKLLSYEQKESSSAGHAVNQIKCEPQSPQKMGSVNSGLLKKEERSPGTSSSFKRRK